MCLCVFAFTYNDGARCSLEQRSACMHGVVRGGVVVVCDCARRDGVPLRRRCVALRPVYTASMANDPAHRSPSRLHCSAARMYMRAIDRACV